MFIIQVTVNPADQNSTVLVAHPSGNGHIVDPAHHGVADKVVAAIVVAEAVHTSQSSSFVECFFETARRCILPEHPGCGKQIGRTVAPGPHLLEQLSQEVWVAGSDEKKYDFLIAYPTTQTSFYVVPAKCVGAKKTLIFYPNGKTNQVGHDLEEYRDAWHLLR